MRLRQIEVFRAVMLTGSTSAAAHLSVFPAGRFTGPSTPS